MSQIDVVTQFILQTAAYRGELTDVVAQTIREVEKINELKPELTVALAPLNTDALDALLVQLQTTAIEIPVRFVPEGNVSPGDVANSVVHQAQTAGGVPIGQPVNATAGQPATVTSTPPQVEQAYAAAQEAQLTGQIVGMSADGVTAREIAGEIGDRIPESVKTSATDFVRNVRAATGVPGESGSPDFTAWQNEYRQRADGETTRAVHDVPPDITARPAAPDPVRMAANRTVDQSDDLGPMIRRLTESVTDAAHEIEDFALLVARANEDLRGSLARGSRGGRDHDDDDQAPRRRVPAGGRSEGRGSVPDEEVAPPGDGAVGQPEAGPYDIAGDYDVLGGSQGAGGAVGNRATPAGRAAATRARREGQKRAMIQGEAANRNGVIDLNMEDAVATAENSGPEPEDEGATEGGGGHGGPNGRGGSFVRLHPALGRFFGAAGGLYAADLALRGATAYGDAGYGQNANAQFLARGQAADQSLRSLPFVGQLGGGIYDNITALGSYFRGDGYVSANTQANEVAKQAQVQDQVGRANVDSRAAANAARTYDQRTLIEQNRRTEITKLEQELGGDDYRVTTDAEARRVGRRRGTLNAAGESRDRAERERINAEADRARRDDAMRNTAEDDTSAVNVRQTQREGRAGMARANLRYDRRAELNDTLAGIDEGLDRQRAQASTVLNNPAADPRERQRAQQELNAAEVKATQDREAAKLEAVRKATLEDSQIVSSTAQATQRAVGNTYGADREAFEESWRQKLSVEQDGNKRILLQRQKAAEDSARQYQMEAQARRENEQAGVSELRTAGRGQQAQQQEADDAFREQARAAGLYDPKTGRILDDSKLDPAQRDRLGSLRRTRQAAYNEIARQQRYGTEDIERQADSTEGELNGDRYGARTRDIRAREARSLEQNQDRTPEGERRRAAIRRGADAEDATNQRQRGDEIANNNLSRQQAEDRTQGRTQLADARGEVVDVARQIRDAQGDPERLRSVVGSAQARLRERMMGDRRSEMFGSVEEYANNRFVSAANNDGGAYQVLKNASDELGKALNGPAGALNQVAQKFMQALSRLG